MSDVLSHLDEQREVWDEKPLIRALYGHYHRLMLERCTPGSIVEIGAGCGTLKQAHPDVISLDIVASRWVDLVADAQLLPFTTNSIDNLVMLDVLHHIPRPLAFLAECQRVLQRRGRVIFLEPGISSLSRWFYHYIHPEPVDLTFDVASGQTTSSDAPFDSNQAVPTLLLETDTSALQGLVLAEQQWLAPCSYAMSGGFRAWQLYPQALLAPLLKLEQLLPRWLLRHTGFRVLGVLEKRAH